MFMVEDVGYSVRGLLIMCGNPRVGSREFEKGLGMFDSMLS